MILNSGFFSLPCSESFFPWVVDPKFVKGVHSMSIFVRVLYSGQAILLLCMHGCVAIGIK